MSEQSDQNAERRDQPQTDEARSRAAGAAFDQRMKEFATDPPRAARSDQDRRRKR